MIAACSCSLRGNAYDIGLHLCLLCRHPWCRRVCTSVPQDLLYLAYPPLVTYFSIYHWAVFPFHVSCMTFFSLNVLLLDLMSFAPSKIARVLPPWETLPDSPNWNHFSFYYIDPSSHYSASPFPGLSLRHCCTLPSPNCSAHWGCSINIWRLIPLKYLRCVLHALHL